MTATEDTATATSLPVDPWALERRNIAGFDVLVAVNPIARDLRDILLASRNHDPARPYLIEGDRVVTFGELVPLVGGTAALLAGLGVGKGDRVCVSAANSIEWTLAAWATVGLGAIVVGANAWWHRDETKHALDLTTPTVLITDRKRADLLAGVELPASIEHHLVIGETFNVGTTGDLPDAEIDPDDCATILFTSGTTGKAKGVIGTHRAATETFQNMAWAGAVYFPTVLLAPPPANPSPPATVMSAPMFHVAGLQWGVMFPAAMGSTVILNPGRYDATTVMGFAQRHKVTSLGGVPTMMTRIVDHPDRHNFDLSSVVSVSWGGAPPAPTLVDQCLETFPNLTLIGTGYGLTETCGLLLFANGTDYVNRQSTAGKALPSSEVRVTSPNGLVLGPDEEGEVELRGPMVMPGYWNRPDANAEAFTADGWFRSGDLGRIDKDGFVTLTGRIKELIIRGGENVYPVEIEEVLVAHPDVLDAAVVGRPHADLGEEVIGVAQVTNGSTLTGADLRSLVASRLAGFKVPVEITVTNEPLPRNAAGKLIRDTIAGGTTRFTETL